MTPRLIGVILTVGWLGLFCNYGCDTSPTKVDERPPAPRLLPTPPDTALIEIGIDAVEFGDYIQLDWEAGGTSPHRYRIYRSAHRDSEFVQLAEVSGHRTTFLDSQEVVIGVRYYYFVTAVDIDGLESDPSDTLSYLLVEKPVQLSATQSVRPIFSWQVHSVPAEEYVIKLLDGDSGARVWISRIRSSYTQTEQIRYNVDGTATLDSLSAGRRYRWRVDVVGPDAASGSESRWHTFIIQ